MDWKIAETQAGFLAAEIQTTNHLRKIQHSVVVEGISKEVYVLESFVIHL